MFKRQTLTAAAIVIMGATASVADGWSLDPSMSLVSFGSIKNDYNGESHHFGKIGGNVTDTGAVTVELALASVQTNIDIRNERMSEFVFNNAPSATITADVDMAAMNALAIGDSANQEIEGTVTLLGEEVALGASVFVLRLSADKVMVTTNGMVMLSTEDAALDDGIDKLQELAGLDSITRVSPVTLRLVFDKN